MKMEMSEILSSVYHSNYSEWNYNLFVNLDHDPIKNKKTNRFLVMNTKYKDGDYYFGKAYAAVCEIEGDESYIRVSVDLTSQDGQKLISQCTVLPITPMKMILSLL